MYQNLQLRPLLNRHNTFPILRERSLHIMGHDDRLRSIRHKLIADVKVNTEERESRACHQTPLGVSLTKLCNPRFTHDRVALLPTWPHELDANI